MKAKHKKALICFAAMGLFLGSTIFDDAKAQYVAQESYTTVIDGNNGGKQVDTSSSINSYLIQNIQQAPEEYVSGGGLFSWSGNVENSLIQNNRGNMGGGAYLVAGVRQVNNTKFLSNHAEYLGGGLKFGGSSSMSMYQVWNCEFEDNSAGTRGGALHIDGSPEAISIQNTDFINNRAGQEGGAIYLDIGDAAFMSNIIANDGKTHVFSGNMQGVEEGYHLGASANAIYIQNGKFDIKTAGKAGSSYIVNDGIEGSSPEKAKMDIDSSAEDGRIELNNQIKNITINHKKGNLILNASNQLSDGTPIMKNVDLTITADGKNNLRFDMANGKIDTLQLRNLTIKEKTGNKQAVIAFDADLNEGKSDLFEVSGTMTGGINFDTDHFEINIIEDGDAESFQLFSKIDDNFNFQGELVQYNGDKKYKLRVGENGLINIIADTTNGLSDAVSTADGIREYKALPDKDIILKESLGVLSGESLRIDMNNNVLDGGQTQGITVSDGQKLEIKNAAALTNFYSEDNGAVVNNANGSIIITDSVVSNNKSEGLGGAIYSKGGEIILNAETKDVILANNTANGTPNDIYLEQSAETRSVFAARENSNSVLRIMGDKNTVISSGIKGNGEIHKQDAGVFELGGNNSDFTGDFYLKSGEFRLAQNATFFNAVNSYLSDGTKINLINNSPKDNINLGNVNLNGNVSLGIDADATTGASDKIGAASVQGEGKIIIDKVNLTSANKPALNNINFNVIELDKHGNSPLFGNVELTAQDAEVMGPIYNYKIAYNPQTGMLTFTGGGKNSDGYNPAILASPVATLVGGYLTQLHSYDMAFSNAESYMLLPQRERQAIKNMNKYASLGGGIFSINGTRENQNAWFKPYSTMENVKLNNGPRVSNVAYGTFFGYDSDIQELGNGFDGVWSIYAGYNGSHQAYQGNSIWQNGGTLGATGVLYKGNFFTALTANVGANAGQASTMFGTEDFTMLTSGIASKTGYNIETFDGKFIIQPNYLMSYSFVKTFDYTNAAGINIDAKPLNAIQIAPGLRLIGNLPKGFQPYFGCSMVWNIIDDTKFTANDVSLPELSIKPYFNYGIGVQKRGKRLSGYLQTMFRSGGRNGIGIQGGLQA